MPAIETPQCRWSRARPAPSMSLQLSSTILFHLGICKQSGCGAQRHIKISKRSNPYRCSLSRWHGNNLHYGR